MAATVNVLRQIADTLAVLADEMKKLSGQPGFEKFAVEQPFEEVKSEPEKKAKADPGVSYDELRRLCSAVSAAGKTGDIKEILNGLGVQKLSQLPEDKWADMYKKVNALKGET